MYERFHNLRERPFSLTPDPDYLYPSRVHKEALGYLRYGIEGRAGFIVITGEVGSGKTTLLQTTIRTLDKRTSIARLVHTMLDARDLIEAVMLDFGLDPGHGRSKPHLLRDLARYLVDQRLAGRLALLVIDEAQNLDFSALEEIRMLSNLETEKSKLIQILLVGQPSLRERLARPELEQLRQRITVSYHLQALDRTETAAYIDHRLRRAAMGTLLQFPPEVTDLIYRHSRGVPRKINVIADAILLFSYGEGQHAITAALTEDVLKELASTGVIADAPLVDSLAPDRETKAPTQPAPPRPPAPVVPSDRSTADRPVVEFKGTAAALFNEASRLEMEPTQPPSRPARTQIAALPADRPNGVRRSIPPTDGGRRSIPPMPAVAPPRVATTLFRPAQPGGFWSRVLRGLFTSAKPALEE